MGERKKRADVQTLAERARLGILDTGIAKDLLAQTRALLGNLENYPAPGPIWRDEGGGKDSAIRWESWCVRFSSLPQTVRNSFSPVGTSRRYVATGGVVISVRCQPGNWTHRQTEFERRLPPDFSDRRFLNAVGALRRLAREEAHRCRAVEQVYALQNLITADDLALIDKSDRESSYDRMTVADANWWVRWIYERHPEVKPVEPEIRNKDLPDWMSV